MNQQRKSKKNAAPNKARQVQAKTINKPVQNSPRPGRPPAALVHAACALTDPFCDHARGARLPTVGRVRTLAYPCHMRVGVPTDANGAGAILVLPSYLNVPWVNSTVTAGVAGYGTVAGAGLLGNVTAYRIVTYGFIIRNVTNAMVAQGMINIRTFTPKLGTSLAGVSVMNYNCDEFQDVPITAGREVSVVLKPTDISYQEFRTPAETWASGGNVTAWVAPARECCQIGITGGPISTATVLDVEFFINYEVVIDDGDGNQQLSVSAPHLPPIVKSVVESVTSETKSIVVGGIRTVGAVVVNAVIKNFTRLAVGAITKNPQLALAASAYAPHVD